MRFKLDENLPGDLCALLRDAGHDATTVGGQRLSGSDDATLYAICQHEGRAIVTLDVGFGNIRAYPPEQSAGVIVLRPASQSRPAVLTLIQRVLSLLGTEPIEGKLWIIGEDRIRIRS